LCYDIGEGAKPALLLLYGFIAGFGCFLYAGNRRNDLRK